MEYRIKVIEKNSGDKEYYPQYQDENSYWYGLKAMFSPIVFFICLFKLDFTLFTDYFWTNISKEKDILQCQKRGDFILIEYEDVLCKTEEEARLEIKKHYAQHITDKNHREDIQTKEHLKKNKTIYYLNINNPM